MLLSSWTEDRVCQWLRSSSLGKYEKIFRQNGVDGRLLLDLSDSELREDLQIQNKGVRQKLLRLIKQLQRASETAAQHNRGQTPGKRGRKRSRKGREPPAKKRKLQKETFINPETWTTSEIDLLTNYWALYGDRYDFYLPHFLGKSVDEIAKKIKLLISPRTSKGSTAVEKSSTGLFWTAKEDEKLLALWPIYKKQWDKYVIEFNGRSKIAIRQHVKILLEKQNQINLGTVISVYIKKKWLTGMVSKIWTGEYKGMVSVTLEGTEQIQVYNLDVVKYRILSQPLSRKRRQGNRRNDSSDKISKYRGVRWEEHSKKWIAVVCFKKSLIPCGSFNTEQEAAEKYDERALKLMGDKAALNFPEKLKKQPKKGEKDYAGPPEENPYLGVTWDKHARKWKVHVHHNKKVQHCGYFSDLLEAAHEYDRKCLELKGLGTKKLNFPIVSELPNGSQFTSQFNTPMFRASGYYCESFQFQQQFEDIVPTYVDIPCLRHKF